MGNEINICAISVFTKQIIYVYCESSDTDKNFRVKYDLCDSFDEDPITIGLNQRCSKFSC
jgi:hypothetical protein